MERFQNLLSQIEYKDWRFVLGNTGSHQFLQIRFLAADAHTGELAEQSSRKYLLSEHMTDSEFVQTVFLAVKIAEEHEIRETFKFRDGTPFAPHFDVYALLSVPEDARQHLELAK